MQEPIFCKKLKEEFPQYIKNIYESYSDYTVVIDKEGIIEICKFLKDDSDSNFNYLSDICGVDYHPERPRFMVVYHLYSIPLRHRLRLKYSVDEGEEVHSVTSIWKTANWHERETYDMYGIAFKGHPDLRRIYMWDGFEGYPLRKDFPLRGYKDEYNPYGEEKE